MQSVVFASFRRATFRRSPLPRELTLGIELISNRSRRDATSRAQASFVGGHLMYTHKSQPRVAAIIGIIISSGVVLAGATIPQPAAARVVAEARADHCHGPPSKAWCHDRKDATESQQQTAARKIPCGPPAKQFRCTLPSESATSSRDAVQADRARPRVPAGPPGRWPPYRR